MHFIGKEYIIGPSRGKIEFLSRKLPSREVSRRPWRRETYNMHDWRVVWVLETSACLLCTVVWMRTSEEANI